MRRVRSRSSRSPSIALAALALVALAQQPVHRLVEVAVLHEVVGQVRQHLLDVEVVEVVALAEAAIAVANGHYRFLER